MWWCLGRPVSSVGWWPGISLALIRRRFGLGWPGVRLSGLRRWATRVLVTTAGPVPVAPLLDRALPAPGEGPSEQARRAGRFAMDIHARTSNGGRDLARIAAAADPGCNASSVMSGESALCLVLDAKRLPAVGGVLTPAIAMSTLLRTSSARSTQCPGVGHSPRACALHAGQAACRRGGRCDCECGHLNVPA